MTRRGQFVLAAATLLFVVFGLRQAWTDGITYDETFTIASGVAAWTHHDLRATPQHPPIGKVLAAIPVAFMGASVPKDAAWHRASGHSIGSGFVHRAYVRGDLHRYLFASRVVPVLETAAIAW